MTLPTAILPLAIDIPAIGTMVVLAIAFIGWMINLANQKNQPPPPARRGKRPARGPRPRDERLSDEIDVFLQEVTGRKQNQLADDEIEIVPDDEIRQPRRRRPRPAPAPPPVKPKEKPPLSKRRPLGSNIANRAMRGSGGMGSGLRDHLEEYMDADRIEHEVSEHLGEDVDASVEEHLGVFSAAEAVPGVSAGQINTSTRNIVALLRDPVGIQQAILLNEILSRPKSLRTERKTE